MSNPYDDTARYPEFQGQGEPWGQQQAPPPAPPPPPPPPSGAPGGYGYPPPMPPQPPRPPQRSKAPWVVLGVAAGLVIVAAVGIGLTWGRFWPGTPAPVPMPTASVEPAAPLPSPADVAVSPSVGADPQPAPPAPEPVVTVTAPAPVVTRTVVVPAPAPDPDPYPEPDTSNWVYGDYGAKECVRTSGPSFSAAARNNATTSCPFVKNVRVAYVKSGLNGRPGKVKAYSPTTKKTYVMTCSVIRADGAVLCTGGVRGRVLLYDGQLVVPR